MIIRGISFIDPMLCQHMLLPLQLLKAVILLSLRPDILAKWMLECGRNPILSIKQGTWLLLEIKIKRLKIKNFAFMFDGKEFFVTWFEVT